MIGNDVGQPARLGHQTMRERAAASGATFQLDSQPGAGTCVAKTWMLMSPIESITRPLRLQISQNRSLIDSAWQYS